VIASLLLHYHMQDDRYRIIVDHLYAFRLEFAFVRAAVPVTLDSPL